MSIPRIASFAALLPLLLAPLAGCSRVEAPEPDPGRRAEASVAASSAACVGTGARWIGRQVSTNECLAPPFGITCACPAPLAPSPWRVTRAFDLQSSVSFPISIPDELDWYCAYDWTGPGTGDPSVLQAALGGAVEEWFEDSVVVASLSAPGGAPGPAPEEDVETRAPFASYHPTPIPALREWLREGFRDLGRGGLGTLPVGIDPRANVEIAVLDTSPTDPRGGIPLGTSAHGHLVGWTSRDLLCDDPLSVGCFAHISTYLALPYITSKHVDCDHGGAFGTRVDLARQIFLAVETWKHRVGPAPHLVIPLALGWDQRFEKPKDLATRAVHDALVHASCHGAFLAAAAGNDTGGPTPAEGAVYPAAWESEAAPGPADCKSFEGKAWSSKLDPVVPPSNVNVPLILSIGGVDREDRPIALTRPKSLTQLVALAFQAAAGDPSRPLPQPLTGTSIGVTVAGAAAAAVWAYDPTLTAREVMSVLTDTATPLAGPDLLLSAPGAGAPGRISLCDAIVKACSSSLAPNPRCSLDPVICSDWTDHEDPLLPLAIEKSIEAHFAGTAGLVSVPPPPCQLPGPCPVLSTHQLSPAPPPGAWVHPQPIDPGCSVCMFRPSYGLYVELDGRVSLPSMLSLSLYSGRSGVPTSYNFNTSPGQQSMSVAMTTSPTVTRAMISWQTSTGSVAEEIAVVR